MTTDMAAMLALVERAWREHPSWRFGQLVANAAARGGEPPHTDPFYVDDERMTTGLLAITSEGS